MTVRISEVFRSWLGWCPNAPVTRPASAVLVTPPATACPVEPDSGPKSTGRIGRGIRFTADSARILVQNKGLLLFALLSGIVMAFMFIANYWLHLLTTYPYYLLDFQRWLVLTFAVELVAVFSLTVLLAGLLLSVSPARTSGPASFREGLLLTRAYLRPLADWSVIIALCTTALFVLLSTFGYSPFVLYPVLDQFPFNFVLFPEVYSIGPIGGTYAILSAISMTIVLSGIGILMYAMTLFVVPLIVIENRHLPGAFAGTVPLLRATWGETLACFCTIGLVLLAILSTSLLFRVIYGIVAPDMLLFWYPGDAWIAGAVLYMFAFCTIAFIALTIAGIATLNLYTYGKTAASSRLYEGESIYGADV